MPFRSSATAEGSRDSTTRLPVVSGLINIGAATGSLSIIIRSRHGKLVVVSELSLRALSSVRKIPTDQTVTAWSGGRGIDCCWMVDSLILATERLGAAGMNPSL